MQKRYCFIICFALALQPAPRSLVLAKPPQEERIYAENVDAISADEALSDEQMQARLLLARLANELASKGERVTSSRMSEIPTLDRPLTTGVYAETAEICAEPVSSPNGEKAIRVCSIENRDAINTTDEWTISSVSREIRIQVTLLEDYYRHTGDTAYEGDGFDSGSVTYVFSNPNETGIMDQMLRDKASVPVPSYDIRYFNTNGLQYLLEILQEQNRHDLIHARMEDALLSHPVEGQDNELDVFRKSFPTPAQFDNYDPFSEHPPATDEHLAAIEMLTALKLSKPETRRWRENSKDLFYWESTPDPNLYESNILVIEKNWSLKLDTEIDINYLERTEFALPLPQYSQTIAPMTKRLPGKLIQRDSYGQINESYSLNDLASQYPLMELKEITLQAERRRLRNSIRTCVGAYGHLLPESDIQLEKLVEHVCMMSVVLNEENIVTGGSLLDEVVRVTEARERIGKKLAGFAGLSDGCRPPAGVYPAEEANCIDDIVSDLRHHKLLLRVSIDAILLEYYRIAVEQGRSDVPYPYQYDNFDYSTLPNHRQDFIRALASLMHKIAEEAIRKGIYHEIDIVYGLDEPARPHMQNKLGAHGSDPVKLADMVNVYEHYVPHATISAALVQNILQSDGSVIEQTDVPENMGSAIITPYSITLFFEGRLPQGNEDYIRFALFESPHSPLWPWIATHPQAIIVGTGALIVNGEPLPLEYMNTLLDYVVPHPAISDYFLFGLGPLKLRPPEVSSLQDSWKDPEYLDAILERLRTLPSESYFRVPAGNSAFRLISTSSVSH